MKKLRKQVLLFLLAVMMVLSNLSMVSFADEDDLEIPKVYFKDDDNEDLRIVIGSTEEVTIGKSNTISLTLKNNTSYDWRKTHVWIGSEQDHLDYYEFDIDEDENSMIRSLKNVYPFEVTDSLNQQKSAGSINSGAKKTVNLKVSLKKDLEQGYYPVLIRVTTEDKDGHLDDYEKTLIIWAEKTTTDAADKEDKTGTEPVAFALGENQPTPQGVYGEVMNFGINLRNTGYRTAFDVRVEMGISEDASKFPFEINDGNYDRWMNSIGANETVEVPYSMAIRADAESGYYPITYTIRYREEENGNFAEPIEDVMYVRIIGNSKEDQLSADAGENERTKARIIVESFETEPATVMAGEDFVLKVKMKNASSKISASNILFTLEPESVNGSPIFTTVNGSDSVVINNLAPGKSEVLTFYYTSSPSAEQRSYTVTISEQYDSPEFKNAKETVKIALPLKQEPRLNTSNVDVMPNAIDVGQDSNIMLNINNTGKVILYNVTAIFHGDSIMKSENYIGNIKPGESGSVDAMVSAVAPSTDDGMITLTITYEDESGQLNSVDRELQLLVFEPVPEDDMFFDDMMGEVIEPEPTLMDRAKEHAVPLGIAAAAVLGGIVFFVKRKKKAGMDDEII